VRLLAVIGGVMATQGLVAIGLTGTVVALVGLYLIAGPRQRRRRASHTSRTLG
jgi:hypothetical protein